MGVANRISGRLEAQRNMLSDVSDTFARPIFLNKTKGEPK
jgi:hypothetical protein